MDLTLSEMEKKGFMELLAKLSELKCAFYDTVLKQQELQAQQQKMAQKASDLSREAEALKQKIQDRAEQLASVRGLDVKNSEYILDPMEMKFVPRVKLVAEAK